MSADRDLLFGLLALQNGLINQVQLVAAFQAWTLEKSKSLADHLEARGDLSAGKRALLEALVEAHLEAHGGEIEKSLAAISAGKSTQESLARIRDRDIEASLGHVGLAHGSTLEGEVDRTATYSVGSATSDGQRFRVLRPHARGGLGAVFIALDTELHREVALKQILDDHADDPTSRQRFVLEAEVTGGLEHPGIVPVYGLGTYDNGRPYYAMRFVRGDSLKEAIERFHGDQGLKRNLGRRSLELHTLLRRFVDVCNAIDYAHSRGVLHRDIKPGNVIVGKHGETLVVDWGLAKATGRSDTGLGEPTLTPSPSSGTAETLPGSALGTPAYMSPEQAEGNLERLGPWSDVYSLGATLYCLLTGRPPFEGDVADIVRAAQRGEFRPPRQLDSSIDRALEVVCLNAMATRPEDRYASSRALADDVDRWLAGEPVSAWREPWSRRNRRWLRRHPRSMAAAVVLLIGGVVALGTGSVLINRQRTRAEANFRLAREAVDDMYTQVAERWLSEQAQLEPLQREFLLKALRFYEQFAQPNSNDPALRREAGKAARRVGEIQQRLGAFHEGETAFRRALGILGARETPGRATSTEDRYEQAAVHNRLGWLLWTIGRSGEADCLASLDLISPLVQPSQAPLHYRREQAYSHSSLGLQLMGLGRFREAEPELRAALGLQGELARIVPDEYQAGLSQIWLNLGLLLKQIGRLDEAETALRRAVAAAKDQADQTPRKPHLRDVLANGLDELANLLSFRGRDEEAGSILRQADSLAEALATDFPSVVGYQNARASIRRDLANLLQDRGLLADAEPAYSRAIEMGRALVAAHPEVLLYRRALAIHHNNLANLYRSFGRPADAGPEFRLALELIEKLAADYPERLDYQSLVGQILQNQAIFLRATGRFTEAEPVFQRTISHLEALAAAHPEVVEIRSLLATACAQAGDLLQILHRPGDGERAFRSGAELAERLAAEFPDVPGFANAAAVSLAGLEQLALDLGELSRARQFQERLIRHARAALGANRRNSNYRGSLLHGYGLLAELQVREGDDQASEGSARAMEALAESPIDFYNVACFLGLVVKAAASAPWPEVKRADIAQSYGDRAVASLRTALDRGYRNPGLIRTDPDLDSLRSRPDFQLLMMDLTFPAEPFALVR